MASPQTVPEQTALTPAELVALRPDLAAMRAQLPPPAPSSVAMQADAQSATDGLAYFDYAGQRFTLSHTPDAFDLADLAEYMDQAEEAPIRALGGINRMLRLWLADFDALRRVFRTKYAGQDMDAQMLGYGEIASLLFEATTARPTGAPAATSDGRSATSTSSKDGSPSPAPSPSTGPSASETSTPA